MDKETLFILMFAGFNMAAGVILSRLFFMLRTILVARRHSIEYPNLTNVTNDHCKVHSYEKISLAFSQLPVGNYLVCTQCGHIPEGRGLRLNGPAMEVFKSELVRRQKVNG